MLNTMSGTVQDYWDGVHAFKLVQGTPARDAIVNAELAARGWTGNDDPLFAQYGYFKLFALGAKDPEILTKGLGEHYYGEALFKHFPSGLPTHTPVACALELYHEHGVRPEDIDSIEIGVSEQAMTNYYAKPWSIRAWPHGDAAFSYQYAKCTALLRGTYFLEAMTEAAITAPDINALIARSSVRPMGAEHRWGSTVTVRLTDGREVAVTRTGPPADPVTDPATDEFILDKYHRQVAASGFISGATATELAELVLRLDELDDLSELTRLAAGEEN